MYILVKNTLTRKIWENGNFNIRRYNEIEKIIKNRKLHELNEKDFKDMGIDDCKTANNFYSVFQWCGLNDKSEKCDYKELNAFYYKHSANSIERGIYNCPDQLITIINYHYKNKIKYIEENKNGYYMGVNNTIDGKRKSKRKSKRNSKRKSKRNSKRKSKRNSKRKSKRN